MIEPANPKSASQRGFLGVRIALIVHLPLVAGTWVFCKINEKYWVDLKYECVPDFCFTCGVIGQSGKNYSETELLSEVSPGNPCYGPWMTEVSAGREVGSHVGDRSAGGQ